MLNTILLWLFKALMNFLWDKGASKLAADKAESEAKAADKKNSDEAIIDLRKGGKNPAQTVEEREKDAEGAFDNFHNRVDRH